MHVMLDLETWGTRPGSALRSIGAVVFDIESQTVGATFYRNIMKDSCVINGLTVDPDTVAWWARQSRQAATDLERDQKLLIEVVREFHDWFRSIGGKFIWCQGGKFWDVRCTRTIYAIADFDQRSVPRAGTAHNALDDAAHQARCVQLAFAKLRAAPIERGAA